MNIEIANRLVKLRKEKGMSQEELADALGISRQAVSKWERAEASPDTDNLICLAKLYNISLDDILSTDESVEDIAKEQKEKDDDCDSININDEGIFIKDKDGSKVIINSKGVKAFNKNGVTISKGNKHRISNWIEGSLFLLATIAYILLGTFLNLWAGGWVVFLLPEIICSFIRCFESKNPSKFNMAFLATFVFFFVCMILPGLEARLWHPMWVVFLLIPVYYSIVKPFSHQDECEDDDDQDDDD